MQPDMLNREELWIAFRFFIFVLRTQRINKQDVTIWCCELLSDFLSLFFEHNKLRFFHPADLVVNCFQIFYLCSSNTTLKEEEIYASMLWIAFRFFIFVLRTQRSTNVVLYDSVVNCFQIFYLCSSNTTCLLTLQRLWCCELLSDFLSLFFEHNKGIRYWNDEPVVNCFQIFYLCSSNTT